MKIRRKDGMIMEEDLLNVINEQWQTVELLFDDNPEAKKWSLSTLEVLLETLGYVRVAGGDVNESDSI